MKLWKLWITSSIIAFSGIVAFSQAANEQGFKPYGSYTGGEIDQVNISNGHLELRIPLLSYPQRGGRLKLSFLALFHNPVWNERTETVPTTNVVDHFWEWDSPPGVIFLNEQAPPTIDQILVKGGTSPSDPPFYAYALVMPDRSERPLGNVSGTVYNTIDATGMKWDSGSQTVTFSDGTRYSGVSGSTPVLEDSNGNQITFGSTVVDTMGRNIPAATSTTDFTGCTGSLPISSASVWSVPGANGSSNVFKFCNAKVTIYTHHWTTQNTGSQQYFEPNGPIEMLQSIVLPDQTAWTFDYSQPDANGINWGDLVKVTFPAGATISYTWTHAQGCHHPFGAKGNWSGVLTQRTVDAQDGSGPHTWTYSAGKVTDPLGNDTVHTFTDLNSSCSFFESRTDFYQGPQSGGNLLKTVTTDYSWAVNPTFPNVAGQSPAPPMNVVPIRKTTSWPNGQVRKTELGYDSGFTFNSGTSTGIYGKEVARNEFDYGASSPGSLLKSTQTSYLWQTSAGAQYLSFNVLDVPSGITVQDGSGNQVSQTTISYDEATPAASGISTSHDLNPANGNIRGNATTTHVWLSGSTTSTTTCPVAVSNGFLTTTKSYLDTGMLSKGTDACGHQTTSQYSSTYAGAYVTQSCNALNQCSTMSYDLNTGAVAQVTDPNGQTTGKNTTYSYDNFGRLKSITYPDGGQANAFYSNPTTLEVKRLENSTANVWIDTFTYFDGLLRPKQTRLVDPEGDVFFDATYDALGRIATISNPHRSATAPTDGIAKKSYDVFGRVTNVIHPDGNVLQAKYSDPGVVTLIDETGRPRRETRDALGRLVKVEEPSGGTAGAKATASVTIAGSLQSKAVGGQAAIAASATILISGTPQNCDTGTVTLSVGAAAADTISYGCQTTSQQMAQSLAANLSSSQVTATASQADASHWQIKLTASSSGTSGNGIAFSIGYKSFYSGQFAAPYVFGPGSGTLSGGQNAVAGTTVYDAGTVTLSLDGYSATASYGNGTGLDSTAPAVAADLVSKISLQLPTTNPPFTASVPSGGTAISVVWSSVGSAGNLNSIAITGTTTQTTNFSLPSFAGCQPISANPQNCTTNLSGGIDPYSLDSPPSWPTLYSYDLLGNLLRVEQHGNTTDSTQWRIRTFQYDSLSRITQSNNPESGQLNFKYDADANLITRSDPRGVTVTRTYDVLNRLLQETYSDGTPTTTFAYDQATAWGISLNNTIGRLTSTAAAVGTAGSVLSYDPVGRTTNEWVCLPSNCGTTSYPITAQYDVAGHLTSLTYPSGRTVTTAYNSAGRALNSVLANFAGQAANYTYYSVPQAGTASSWGYNPDGSLRVGMFGNGISETYGFNNRMQLNAITASSASQTWLSKIYGLYDVNNHDNGTIWSIADGVSASHSQTYQYDPVGRVISALQQDGSFNQAFSYDPWGNMTTSGTNNFNPLYDGNNRISGAPANCTGANQYCYDAAGNMLNDGYHQYAYDGSSRIKSVDGTGATYTYDADGVRVGKTVAGKTTEYINFQGLTIAEKDVSTGYWSDYIFFNGRRIVRANTYEHQLHVSGQVCGNCGWQWYQFNFTNLGTLAGRTIQAGDSLRWVQWQNTGSAGGIIMTFADGTDSCCTSAPVLADQNGELILRSAVVNQWDYRVVSLTPDAGKKISQIRLSVDGTTQPGQWDIYFHDLVYVSADGSVWPLFSQNATVPPLSGFGNTGMTQTSATIHDCTSGCPAINTTTYFHSDQIGSARLLSAGYGYPIWQGTFTAFGQEVSPEITTNHYKFSGKERGEAAEGGLDYYGARSYSSVLGRWTVPDWSETPSAVPYAKLTDPQSLNLYSFVEDDPLSHTDFEGHFLMRQAEPTCPDNFGGKCDAPRMPCATFDQFCQELTSQDNKYYIIKGEREQDGEYQLTVRTTVPIYDKNNNLIGAVGVTVVVRFAIDTGAFLGAELSTNSVVPGPKRWGLATDPVPIATNTMEIGYGGAVKLLGATALFNAAEHARDLHRCYFCHHLKKDVVDHPWRTAGRVAQIVVYAAALADPPTAGWGLVGLYATFAGTVTDVGNQAYPDKP